MKTERTPKEGPLKTQKSRFAALAAVVAVLTLMASACGKSDNKDSSKTTTTAAAGASTTAAPQSADAALLKAATAKLSGGGSSLQDTFEQQATADFATAAKAAGGSATITYTKSGSADGKKALADKTLDFAGSDSPINPDKDPSFGTRKILYFPLIASPITVSYHLKGVTKLTLDADTIAKIFQAQITTWDDAAIKKLNPDATLPSTKITVVHRSDGSGTTSNFTKYLVAAAPTTWKLDKGDTVNWPSSTQGAEKSTGVTSVITSTDGAIGYADLSDAAKANLDVAAVINKAGKAVSPSPAGASAAVANAAPAADLTINPLNADGATAYPITSPTYILVDAAQASPAKAATIKAYLNFVLTTAQSKAQSLFYAPLPKALADKAVAQIDSIKG